MLFHHLKVVMSILSVHTVTNSKTYLGVTALLRSGTSVLGEARDNIVNTQQQTCRLPFVSNKITIQRCKIETHLNGSLDCLHLDSSRLPNTVILHINNLTSFTVNTE